MKRQLILFLFFVLFSSPVFSQDPLRFEGDIQQLLAKEVPESGSLIIFTGSSSIRMWDKLDSYLPECRVVNYGFGGSHMSDLLYYADDLILRHKPEIVFIYEGDNDINAMESPGSILKEARQLAEKIHLQLPGTRMIFISPKPSPSRWALQKKYTRLNKKLERWTKKKEQLDYLDVWNIMLDANGQPKGDIFIEDQLHMNARGYDLWAGVTRQYLQALFFDKLSGTWLQEGRPSKEVWRKVENGTYRATMYNLKDGDAEPSEEVRMIEEANTLYYEAKVLRQNQGKAIRFKCTNLNSSEAVFENPEHDFPQKIHYRLKGKNALDVTIGGNLQGEYRERTFIFKREN